MTATPQPGMIEMFGIPRIALVANLEKLRARVCLYGAGPGERCDCKFGATSRGGEDSGCPELRQVIAMLGGAVVLHHEALTTVQRPEQFMDQLLGRLANQLNRLGIEVGQARDALRLGLQQQRGERPPDSLSAAEEPRAGG